MAFCKIVDFLYAAIPSRVVRDLLIRGHLEGCERCRARLVSREEAAALLVGQEGTAAPGDLWRMVEPHVPGKAPDARDETAGLRWERAAGAAALVVLAAAGFWLLRAVQAGRTVAGPVPTAAGFEINYINVGGAPAQAYVYQPNGSDMIVVWAEKTP
jgi:hypothetical protein